MPQAVRDFVDDCLQRHPVVLATELLSFLYAKTHDPDYFVGLARLLERTEDDSAAFNSLLWNLNRHIFTDRAILGPDVVRRVRYDHQAPCYFRVLARLAASLSPSQPKPTAQTPRVVIVSHVVLAAHHSPSRMCLDFAAHLTRLNVPTLVVNTNTLPRTSDPHFHNPFVSNFNHNLNDLQQATHANASFHLYSNQDPILSNQKLDACVRAAEAFNPTLILSQGEFNIVGDLLAKRFPTVCLPTARTEPISAAHVYIDFAGYYDQLEIVRHGLLNHEPMVRQLPPLLEVAPATRTFSRAAYGLKDDQFVFAVVGNRLKHDIDKRFEQVLLDLLRQANQCVVFFVGSTGLSWQSDKLLAFKGRLFFTTQEPDLTGLYTICDAFLNPNRSGGGNSAVIAVHAGLPILTLPRCDVAGVIGDENALENDAKLVAAAVSLANDPEDQAAWRRRIDTIRKKQTDHAKTIKRLLEIGDEAQQRFEQTQPTVCVKPTDAPATPAANRD